MLKNIRYIFMAVVLLMLLSVVPTVKVRAAEEIKANQLINIGVDTEVYESPDENSQSVGSIAEGTAVISKEDPDNGWIKIKYQDIIGYVKLNTIVGQDTSELDKEFDQKLNYNMSLFQSLEQEKSNKLVWKVVIIGLIVAMFAVGIVTAIIKSKKK
jgi:uncharacterized protein YgiM (DUF1202 family)